MENNLNSYLSMKKDIRTGLWIVFFLSLFGVFGFKAFKLAWIGAFALIVFFTVCVLICASASHDDRGRVLNDSSNVLHHMNYGS